MSKKVTSKDLVELLSIKYAPPAWAFFQQVANGTGFSAYRWADAMAMGIWPSRGLELHGFEIKVSRSDWMRELKKPEKAEDLMPYCDFWWIVVADENIVRPEELPSTWGLMVPKTRGLTAKVPAPKQNSVPLDKIFVAALLRRAHETMVLKSDVNKIVEAKVEREKGRYNDEIERLREKNKDWEECIQNFEKASGVRINQWDGGNIGIAVKSVLDARWKNPLFTLKRIRKEAQGMIENIDSMLKEQEVVLKEVDIDGNRNS